VLIKRADFPSRTDGPLYEYASKFFLSVGLTSCTTWITEDLAENFTLYGCIYGYNISDY